MKIIKQKRKNTMENTNSSEPISPEQAAKFQDLMEGAASFGAVVDDSGDPEFKLDNTATDAVLGAEETKTIPPNTETEGSQAAEVADVAEEIEIPGKIESTIDYKSLTSQYAKSANLDYDAERDLVSKIETQADYEEIVGKMIYRDEFINREVDNAIASNPLFVPVLNGTANPLEVLQSTVKNSLGKFYSETEFDNIMETLYVDGLPTEKGKSVIEDVKETYTKAYKDITSNANKYAEETLKGSREYRAELSSAVKTTKLLGAVVPNEEMQTELIEAVQKGDYLSEINKALQDKTKKAETELMLAAIANPRLRAMLAKQIYDLGVNSKKNELLKAKI